MVLYHIQVWKRTYAFYIQIIRELIAGISGCICERRAYYANFYSFIHYRQIRIHFNSHSELDLRFRLIDGSCI